MLNPHIFRAYDVRGLVGTDITPEVFRQVGGAYATLVRRRGGRCVAVGRDNRLSSPDLAGGFVAGVRPAGVDVLDVGVVTTPILYFATARWQLDGGANVTGSHNAIEYNGVKMVHRGAGPRPPEGNPEPRRGPRAPPPAPRPPTPRGRTAGGGGPPAGRPPPRGGRPGGRGGGRGRAPASGAP